MAGANYRTIIVKKSVKITPHLQRVIFTGDDLADFPENYESGYVKLLFANNGEAIADQQQAQGKHLKRTYTVRTFSREENELGIEFSLHGAKNGPAAKWAESTQPGDKILMGGPGPTKLVDHKSDWFLLAGDMSGLPALCCNLELLPSQAQGYAVIEVPSEADKQSLKKPDGIEVKWVINNKPGEKPDALLNAIESLPWKDGVPYVWVACEFESMKRVRQYMKNVHSVTSENMYSSSYWKFNRTEEQHRIDKRVDAGAPWFIQIFWNLITGFQKFWPFKW
ncbi:MAG: siderophore-interacting protein [Cyanobacteria bacterium P01_F01_bin.143]